MRLLLGKIYLVALRGICYRTGMRISSIIHQVVSDAACIVRYSMPGSDPGANYRT
jgi:hypothetical protein